MIPYADVFKALYKAKIQYVVVGGVAVVLYGYLRTTGDLDLIVYLTQDNLEKFYKTLSKIGYIPKVPVTAKQFADEKQRNEWKKTKGMIVFSFVQKDPPFRLIDVFVDEPISYDLIEKKKNIINAEGIKVPLLGIDQLIKLKKIANRGKDQDDIVQLKEIKRLMRL